MLFSSIIFMWFSFVTYSQFLYYSSLISYKGKRIGKYVSQFWHYLYFICNIRFLLPLIYCGHNHLINDLWLQCIKDIKKKFPILGKTDIFDFRAKIKKQLIQFWIVYFIRHLFLNICRFEFIVLRNMYKINVFNPHKFCGTMNYTLHIMNRC